VDDNRDAADSLGLLPESPNTEIWVVYDGPEALETLAVFKPGVVLLDIGMPEMDGCEVARRICQHPGGREATLVTLTDWGQEEDRRTTHEAGYAMPDRRIGDMETLAREVAAWQARRNSAACKVDWLFTTADARIKVKRLYPSIQPG